MLPNKKLDHKMHNGLSHTPVNRSHKSPISKSELGKHQKFE